MLDRIVSLYIAAILAGFALAFVPVSALITAQFKSILILVGGIIIVIFAIAIILLALKALLEKLFK
ncbi:hypothetical protein [Ornithinibacillus bavariensis]|uniref:Uncharacterized protein n=1 Tax=Ornithinibacillus bavariensis TaxID=545502 RepID=A0A920C5V4_9BACI|nr:hypothetical protein [Ornithinibacillus bavariensis]GIO27251.1 hypothetical protein J43TS3_18620 [Ornithinibacillus bavariensis]HAM81860.1 hypothetical protein [Ornithinibacillus sp.]